jgi:hypothetical protein
MKFICRTDFCVISNGKFIADINNFLSFYGFQSPQLFRLFSVITSKTDGAGTIIFLLDSGLNILWSCKRYSVDKTFLNKVFN